MVNIKNFNVVRIDSKGRIVVPFHIREYMGLESGTEVVISNNEKKEMRIFPLINGTAKYTILMSDKPGSLATILKTFAMHNVDILMSTSRAIERGKLAEWSAIMDISACKDIKKLDNALEATSVVKKVRAEKK